MVATWLFVARATPHDSGLPKLEETACPAQTWYQDLDADGVGAAFAGESCEAPVGGVPADGDCDDDRAEVHPEAADLCDGLDNGCDGLIDDDDDAVVDAAATGEVLTVCPAVWNEALALNRTVTLFGFGAGVTVLSGEGLGAGALNVGATSIGLVGRAIGIGG